MKRKKGSCPFAVLTWVGGQGLPGASKLIMGLHTYDLITSQHITLGVGIQRLDWGDTRSVQSSYPLCRAASWGWEVGWVL